MDIELRFLEVNYKSTFKAFSECLFDILLVCFFSLATVNKYIVKIP